MCRRGRHQLWTLQAEFCPHGSERPKGVGRIPRSHSACHPRLLCVFWVISATVVRSSPASPPFLLLVIAVTALWTYRAGTACGVAFRTQPPYSDQFSQRFRFKVAGHSDSNWSPIPMWLRRSKAVGGDLVSTVLSDSNVPIAGIHADSVNLHSRQIQPFAKGWSAAKRLIPRSNRQVVIFRDGMAFSIACPRHGNRN